MYIMYIYIYTLCIYVFICTFFVHTPWLYSSQIINHMLYMKMALLSAFHESILLCSYVFSMYVFRLVSSRDYPSCNPPCEVMSSLCMSSGFSLRDYQLHLELSACIHILFCYHYILLYICIAGGCIIHNICK